MSLTPHDERDDLLDQEIEAWRGFWDTLREDDRKLFKEMLQEIRKYAPAIAAKAQPFPVEPVLMAILLEHYKKIKKGRRERDGSGT